MFEIDIIKCNLRSHIVFNKYFSYFFNGEERILDICKQEKANAYINLSGGKLLYNASHFKQQGIDLKFLDTDHSPYEQLGAAFVPSLSIIDVMMFVEASRIREHLLKEHRLT